VSDDDCISFLRWALPRLGLRWEGFRKPRRQVCRRIRARVGELGLDGLEAYRAYLEARPDEWAVLDRLCRVTISRFYRDRGVWDALRAELDPRSVWSAGCASGEEAYTAALVCPKARVLGTDSDPALLERAARGCYSESSLKELPPELRDRGLDGRCVRDHVKQRVTFLHHDVRKPPPAGPFDLVLCRNLVFSYFSEELQLEVGRGLAGALAPGGALVVGAHETLPDGLDELEPWLRCAYRRRRPGNRG
jgi:chemotaxis protein methyltransferase CheR